MCGVMGRATLGVGLPGYLSGATASDSSYVLTFNSIHEQGHERESAIIASDSAHSCPAHYYFTISESSDMP